MGYIHQTTTRDEMEIQHEQEPASPPGGTTALVTELLSTMSHELRSPLASIKAYSTTLLRRDQRLSRAERRKFLLAIDEASDRLEVVIEHLLEMAQLETGTLLLELSVVNLVQLAREAIANVQRLQRAAGSLNPIAAHKQQREVALSLRIEARGSGPEHDEFFIQADRQQLRKVLDHLLENAINYSPEGRTIELVLRPLPVSMHREGSGVSQQRDGAGHGGQTTSMPPITTGDQELVEICVRDHGMAIPAEHLAQVFEPFYRVDTRLAREVNGLGIGLAICKRVVELHGGRIWAESAQGAGSTFHVWLPREGSMAPQLERRDTHASEEDHDSRGG
jgi:signal transduction histidine kinase